MRKNRLPFAVKRQTVLILGVACALFLNTATQAADNRTFPPVSTSESISHKDDKKRQKAYLSWQKSINRKIKKIERAVSNRAMLDLLRQIEQLNNEVSQLRGTTEEQAHRLKRLQDKQKKIYITQDQRLTDLEERPTAVAPSAAVLPSPIASSASTIDFKNAPINQEKTLSTPEEKTGYQAAFSLVIKAQYEDAITELEDFLDKFPHSTYSDNALYWLGEANYATQRYATALQTFTTLLQRYPRSNKVPGATLKLSFCYYELEQWSLAKSNLLHLINTYPKHSTIALAKKRLQLLSAEGH